MKLITAIIRPEELPAVKQALFESQVYKITVGNVLGCGEQEGFYETYRGVVHEVTLLKKVRLDIAVNEDFVESTVEAIIRGARTNEVGDGKIFITELKDCIRIRTGERAERAIG
jgi:nitrogen regulatory protein P-II 1